MLVYHGKFPPRKAVETLVEAIKTSFNNDHDLGSGLFVCFIFTAIFQKKFSFINIYGKATGSKPYWDPNFMIPVYIDIYLYNYGFIDFGPKTGIVLVW